MIDRTKPWKQQMMEVHKIGEEKPLSKPPWKKFKPLEIGIYRGKEESHTSSN